MTYSASQAAEEIGTTPFKLRTFLRASTDYQACGAGKRYSFEDDDIPELKSRFHTWATAEAKRREERAARIEAERVAKTEAFDVGSTKGSKSVHLVLDDMLGCGRPIPEGIVLESTTDPAAVTCGKCSKQMAG